MMDLFSPSTKFLLLCLESKELFPRSLWETSVGWLLHIITILTSLRPQLEAYLPITVDCSCLPFSHPTKI